MWCERPPGVGVRKYTAWCAFNGLPNWWDVFGADPGAGFHRQIHGGRFSHVSPDSRVLRLSWLQLWWWHLAVYDYVSPEYCVYHVVMVVAISHSMTSSSPAEYCVSWRLLWWWQSISSRVFGSRCVGSWRWLWQWQPHQYSVDVSFV